MITPVGKVVYKIRADGSVYSTFEPEGKSKVYVNGKILEDLSSDDSFSLNIGGQDIQALPAKLDPNGRIAADQIPKDMIDMYGFQDIDEESYNRNRSPDSHYLDSLKYSLGQTPTQPQSSPKAKECAHSYKLYQGFTDSYEYCVHCDKKK